MKLFWWCQFGKVAHMVKSIAKRNPVEGDLTYCGRTLPARGSYGRRRAPVCKSCESAL